MTDVIDKNVRIVLDRLKSSGYEAYIVGGSVRDMLMDKPPHDFDITTSAFPVETEDVFSDLRVIETGIKHGTVTVVYEGQPYEITTYRTEGTYSDGRHPDSVSFTRSLSEDLSRRDFTINAMAFNGEELIDLFGGQQDIKNKIIRCVGNPEKRFSEDALRILRCLRFASVLDFEIEQKTAIAAFKLKSSITKVSVERISSELSKLLCGKGAGRILEEYADIIFEVIPELSPMKNFQQHNPHHIYDVWKHTCKVVDAIDNKPYLRWAALLHDSGKPSTFKLDETGTGHFRGHASVSRDIAEKVVKYLKFDRYTADKVIFIVKRHDTPIEVTEASLMKLVSRIGEENLRDLLCMGRADNKGQNPEFNYRQIAYNEADKLLDDIMSREPCISVKDLAVNGNDMMALGFQGRKIGETLKELLELVIEGKLENNKEKITEYLKR